MNAKTKPIDVTPAIPIDVVMTLITTTIEQVSNATDKRQDAHEARTADQMQKMSASIDKMADTVGESIQAVTLSLAETNKQLVNNNNQFVRWEERHNHQTEKHNSLAENQRTQGIALREMHDEQIKDTLTRKATWRVASIVLTGVLGGALTFAWFIAKMITSSVLVATTGSPKP